MKITVRTPTQRENFEEALAEGLADRTAHVTDGNRRDWLLYIAQCGEVWAKSFRYEGDTRKHDSSRWMQELELPIRVNYLPPLEWKETDLRPFTEVMREGIAEMTRRMAEARERRVERAAEEMFGSVERGVFMMKTFPGRYVWERPEVTPVVEWGGSIVAEALRETLRDLWTGRSVDV